MRMDDKWINTVSNDGQQPNQVGQARQHTPEKNQLLNVHSCFTLKQPGNVRKKTVDEVKKLLHWVQRRMVIRGLEHLL